MMLDNRNASTFVVLATTALLAGFGKQTLAEYPTYADHLTPGIFLDETRATLPQGVSLRKTYPAGVALTKASEGFVDHLYNDPAGYCTVAYGHLIKKSRCNGTEPSEFRGTVPEPRGAQILQKDMEAAEIPVQTALSFHPTDGQFAALVDFVFNVGETNFRRSTLLKLVNARKFDQVPYEWRKWNKANKKILPGLTARREKEIKLFFEGIRAEFSTAQPPAEESIDIRSGESATLGAASPSEMRTLPGSEQPASHALLIGVGDYQAPGVLPLKGPENDLRLMRDLLMHRFGIPEGSITTLQDRDATHTNIQQSFSQLAERVKHGDFVYVYYSGHGATTPDGNGDETAGEDQTWVSYGSREDRLPGLDNWDVLDDEINAWLSKISAKTDQLIVVSDSCHSGTVTRAPLTEVRRAPDDTRLHHPLARQPAEVAIRGAEQQIGIRIGAAQDNDLAYGTDQNGTSYGMFTWYWVDALNQAKPGETWQSVFNRASATLAAQPGSHQQPQITGNANRTLFGGQFVALTPSIPVTQVDSDKKLAWLKAGAVSGVTQGSRYRLLDPAAPHRQDSPCLAITQVEPFESQARFDGCQPNLGDSVVEVEHTYTTTPIKLQVKADLPNAHDQDLEAAIKKALGGLAGFQVVDENTRADWVVYVLRPARTDGDDIVQSKAQRLPPSVPDQPPEVWVITPQGELLHKGLRLSLSDPAKGTELLKQNLVNFARVEEFKALEGDAMPEGLTVQVARLRADPECKTKADCIPIKRPDGITQTYRKEAQADLESLTEQPPRLGEVLAFSASNTSPEPFYLYLITITPEGGIKAVFPQADDNADRVRPRHDVTLRSIL
jgi:GH24 family phage-related lysozyme (muramidase)/uncharacterized caspase-like protein